MASRGERVAKTVALTEFRLRRADFGLSGPAKWLLHASVLQAASPHFQAREPWKRQVAPDGHKKRVFSRSSTPVHSQSIAYTNNAYYGRRR